MRTVTQHRGVLALVMAAVVTFGLALALPAAALATEESVEESDVVPMLRLYNQWSGEHLFTADWDEYDSLSAVGWSREGQAWLAPTSGDPVYRLYNPYTGDHLYTANEDEYKSLGSIGWNQEGVAFHSAPAESDDAQPIYRLYNPWLTAGTHLFTTSEQEYNDLQEPGWQGENVAFYGVKASGGTVRVRHVNQDGRPVEGIISTFFYWDGEYLTYKHLLGRGIYTGVTPGYYHLFNVDTVDDITVDGKVVNCTAWTCTYDVEVNGEKRDTVDLDIGESFKECIMVEDGKLTDVRMIYQTTPAE